MKIDKEFLDEQLAELHSQLEGAKAQLNGVKGALNLCEHLLKVLKMPKPPKEKVHDLKDILPPGAEIVDRTSNEKGEKDGMAKGKETGNKKATGGKKGSSREKAGKKGI